MTNLVDISIALCTYNRKDMLGKALNSLIHQKTEGVFSYEIVIIDDGSTDGTKETIQEIANKSQVPVRYFYEKGLGIAGARNRSIHESRGDWVAFFDDDQLAEPDWLKELYQTANQKNALCVGGVRKLALQSHELDKLHPISRSYLGEIIVHRVAAKSNRKWFPDTGNTIVKRTVFDEVGFFDESLLFGSEDTDFFRKVRMAGVQVYQTPNAIVHHMISAYRLKDDYLKNVAQRNGMNSALMDYRELGIFKSMFICITRIGYSIFITMPLLLKSYVFKDNQEILARKLQILKTIAYTRRLLAIVSPDLFSQEDYFSKFNFRNERVSFN